MSYGPTRNKIDPLVGTRVDRVLHLDLVPGLTPLLLTEFGVPGELVPTSAFTKVLAELAPVAEELPVVEEPALLLGSTCRRWTSSPPSRRRTCMCGC